MRLAALALSLALLAPGARAGEPAEGPEAATASARPEEGAPPAPRRAALAVRESRVEDEGRLWRGRVELLEGAPPDEAVYEARIRLGPPPRESRDREIPRRAAGALAWTFALEGAGRAPATLRLPPPGDPEGVLELRAGPVALSRPLGATRGADALREAIGRGDDAALAASPPARLAVLVLEGEGPEGGPSESDLVRMALSAAVRAGVETELEELDEPRKLLEDLAARLAGAEGREATTPDLRRVARAAAGALRAAPGAAPELRAAALRALEAARAEARRRLLEPPPGGRSPREELDIARIAIER
jgi:hypothetical protein